MKNTLLVIVTSTALLAFNIPGTIAQASTSTIKPINKTVVDGITFFTPPAGFDPLTASGSELQKYHFPPRPKNPQKLAKWDNAMNHVKVKVPDHVIPLKMQAAPLKEQKVSSNNSSSTKTSTALTSSNWSGLESPQPYLSAVGQWNMPWASDPQGELPAYSCTWVGLGGANNNDILVQAGTESDINTSGGGNYYMWVEGFDTSKPLPQSGALNNGYQMELSDSSWQPKPGDQFYVEVDFTPATSTSDAYGTFWLEDVTTGVGYSGSYNVANVPSGANPQSAEWITERTEKGSTLPYLSGFSEINWSECSVSKDGQVYEDPQSFGNYNGYTMWNKAQTIKMAHFSDFITTADGSQGFTDYFDNEGTQDQA